MRAVTFIEVDIRHWNGVITNVIRGEINLNFQCRTFETLTSRQR